MSESKELNGKRYGRLVLVGDPMRRHSGRYIAARCDCGVERLLLLADVLSGRQKSCGCLAREVGYLLRQVDSEGNPKYSATVEYRSWSNAGQRCTNPRNLSFPTNGGRGIKLCEEWVGDFPKFFHQMGPCPIGHCLVRLDPSSDFSKENCRWASSKRGQVFEFEGVRRTASNWSTRLGIPIRRILDELEDGRSIAEIHGDYRESLPIAA